MEPNDPVNIHGIDVPRSVCYYEYKKKLGIADNEKYEGVIRSLFFRLTSLEIADLLDKEGVDVTSSLTFDMASFTECVEKLKSGDFYVKAYGTYYDPVDDEPSSYSYSSHPEGFEETIFNAIEYCFFLYKTGKYKECLSILRLAFSIEFDIDFTDEWNNHDSECGYKLADVFSSFEKVGYDDALFLYAGVLAFVDPSSFLKEIEKAIEYGTYKISQMASFYPGDKEKLISLLEPHKEKDGTYRFDWWAVSKPR